jgi:hypothetical protein
VLRFNQMSLSGIATGSRPPSVVLALRIAKLAKVAVDAVLGGPVSAAGDVPHVRSFVEARQHGKRHGVEKEEGKHGC